MNKHLKELHDISIGILMERTKHKRFFTQSEYESNRGKIDIIKNATNKLNYKL